MSETKQSFVVLAINKIRSSFPEAIIEYEFKDNTELHFFKVTPKSIYENDAFIDLDFELTDTFHESQIEGELCFISENSLIDINPTIIDYPIFTVEHSEFFGGSLEEINLSNSWIYQSGIINEEWLNQVPTELMPDPSFVNDFYIKILMDNVLNSQYYEEERLNKQDSQNYRYLAMAA